VYVLYVRLSDDYVRSACACMCYAWVCACGACARVCVFCGIVYVVRVCVLLIMFFGVTV